MKDEIKKYPKEQQKLKDYLDNVTIEKIIDKLKDDDGMTWWVDWQDQYQPNWKKLYNKEVILLLDYITNLQTIEQQYSALLSENAELKEVNNYSKRELYKINKDRLEANLKLVEENERLKEENKRIFSKVNDDELLISNAMNYAEAQDYKSRCEKAIEYVEQHKFNKFGDIDCGEAEEIINILNGGDKE